jgi:hypothetical protein
MAGTSACAAVRICSLTRPALHGLLNRGRPDPPSEVSGGTDGERANGEAMILEEKPAIRVHFFRQEKSFQDLFDIHAGDAGLAEFGI